MRTTLTLDDDVAAMLNRARAKSSVDFKQLVNDLLRAGLKETLSPKRPAGRYRTPSTDAGDCLIGSIADIEHVLSELDETRRP
jgi:hypothetical protein